MQPPPETAAPDRRKTVITAIVLAALVGGLLIAMFVPMTRKSVASAPVFDAKWVGLPTPQEVIAAYPDKAREANITGEIKVEMRCRVAEGGLITGCTIASESPASYGFGDAALALAPKFRLDAKTTDGSSLLGLPITIPITFDKE